MTSCHVPKTLIYQYAGIYDYRIFHNREIAVSTPQPWIKSASYNKAIYPEIMLNDLTAIQTTAFLVIRNDSLLFEQYWDADTNVISNSFSMAKSFIGLLIGAAVEDGYIKNLDQRASEFIPGFQKNGKSDVRIRDLLTMSSGIRWREGYGGLFGPTTRAYYGRNLKKMIRKLKQEYQPGINYRYQSIDTQILALILENATGKKVADYASEKLWKPLGAEYTALWSLDRKDGFEKAYCCFNAVARDFARIGVMVLHNGNWKGKQLIPADYITRSLTPAANINDRNGDPVNFYGYQWWTTQHKDMKINMAVGLGGQYIIMIPDKNIVIVRLGHKRSLTRKGVFSSDLFQWIDAGLEIAAK